MEVELTDVGKAWAAEFIELTCLSIPYRVPLKVDGKPTIKKAFDTREG